MKPLDLNQLDVETFDVAGTSDVGLAGTFAPIVSTDQVPVCGGATAQYC
jgi:hypothetical protein